MGTVSCEAMPVADLVRALEELRPNMSNDIFEQLRLLFSKEDGIEFSLDSRNRPQGQTIPMCRKVGSEIKRRLGYGPMYGMSVIGYAEDSRWFMQPDVREAISLLGWFEDKSGQSRRKNPPKTAEVKPFGLTKRMVRDLVLQEAAGKCDCCQRPAPFKNAKNIPFLEVHHIQRLADGGPDVPENAVALCPNCHKEMHYGKHAAKLLKNMRSRIERLQK